MVWSGLLVLGVKCVTGKFSLTGGGLIIIIIIIIIIIYFILFYFILFFTSVAGFGI